MADWQSLYEPPNSLKPIQKFLKIASDIERLDPTIAYWTRLFAVQLGFKLDKESKEAKSFMNKVLGLLEIYKQANKSNEKLTDEVVAQANLENFALTLFNKADTIDRDGKSNVNTVKMFYMASVLFEVLAVFGEVPAEMNEKSKYARFKAAYITKCLKTGETPIPGPINESATTPGIPTDNDQQLFGDSSVKLLPPISNQQLPRITSNEYDKNLATTTTNDNRNNLNKSSPTLPAPESQTSNLNNSSIGLKASELVALNGRKLNMENVILAQKCLKYANASLSFNDIKNTVDNLEKALRILKLGEN